MVTVSTNLGSGDNAHGDAGDGLGTDECEICSLVHIAVKLMMAVLVEIFLVHVCSLVEIMLEMSGEMVKWRCLL